MDAIITEIFYRIDEFCKEFERNKEEHIGYEKNSVKRRKRQFIMSDSEIIPIAILFYPKNYRCLKHSYPMHFRNRCHLISPTLYHTIGLWSYNKSVQIE